MLTRLRVKGFKNLVDVDVRFDQFTCIAGPNGAGKSNLFDAITFLGDLASMPIMKAASRARGTNGRISDFQSLFFKNAKGEFLPMLFVAEMIVPGKVTPAAWIQKHISGPGQRTTPFIRTVPSDTEDPSSLPAIKLHGDQKGKKTGPPFDVPARKSPQTVLSGVNSSTHPAALAARREMRSWQLLQLEPSALRRFDNFGDDPHITSTGEHLPGALMRLDNYAEISERLSNLLPDIVAVSVDADEKRQVKTLHLTMKDKQTYTASSKNLATVLICVIPVRMTGAWLIADAKPIRLAVGNPNGAEVLDLPTVKDIESSPDPKEILFAALKTACGRNARRQARFNPHDYRHRVSELTEDLAPLRRLASFKHLEAQVKKHVEFLR